MDRIKGFQGEYRFLSSFWLVKIVIDGVKYASVEQYYQAMKTVNPEKRKQIMEADTPGKAKRLGKKIILGWDWDEKKVEVMRVGIAHKFENLELWARLQKTGDKILIEANMWHDNYWGDCGCQKCRGKTGKNMLGMLLMEERAKGR